MSKNPALPLFAKQLGATEQYIGFIAAASTVVGVLTSIPAGALSDLYGRRRVILAATLVFASAPFLYLFVSTPWLYHSDACSPLASIWGKAIVKGKTRLNILSLIRTQFYNRGAHHFDRRFVSEYKGLLIGNDPVALDAVGARLLQLQRTAHFGEDRPLDNPPTHIFAADEKYKLGVSDLRRINVVKLGWMENSLI